MTRKGLVRIAAWAVFATAAPVHAGFISVSNTVDVAIPDATGIPPNAIAGVATSDITVANAGLISSLTVTLSVAHPWVGDLVFLLTHVKTPPDQIRLLDRPGVPGSINDSDLAVGFPITFSALASLEAESMGRNCDRPGNTVGFTGCADLLFTPQDPFTPFLGQEAQGLWRLTIRDEEPFPRVSGLLDSWTLNFDLAGASVPEPGTLVLIALGLGAFTLTRRQRPAA